MSAETVTDTDQADIHSLAGSLGNAITDLPEYQRFVETQETVQNSEKTQEKIAEFEEKREEYMIARQSGNPSPESVEELQNIQAELNAIPVMAEHLEAKARLEARFTELNDAISAPLALDFGENTGSCCQD